MIDEKQLINFLKNCSAEEKDYWEKHDEEQAFGAMCAYESVINHIKEQPKVGEWIPCRERLPENAKYKGAFCPTYQVMTKYGVTEGWYNPDHESWYILVWFVLEDFREHNIDIERGDIPKRLRVPDGVVTAWMPLPEPWEEAEDD